MISMRDVDAIKERISFDWWLPQGYKKLIIQEKNDHKKREKKDQNFVHEIPFMYVIEIQSVPVVEYSSS